LNINKTYKNLGELLHSLKLFVHKMSVDNMKFVCGKVELVNKVWWTLF